MGKLQTFQREYQIQQMTQRHHEITRLALLGRPAKEIAQELGITEVCVSYTLNSRIVQDKLALLRAQRGRRHPVRRRHPVQRSARRGRDRDDRLLDEQRPQYPHR